MCKLQGHDHTAAPNKKHSPAEVLLARPTAERPGCHADKQHTAAVWCPHLDVVCVCQEHGEAVNAKTPAASGWQAILQCCAEVLINKHGFIITLRDKPTQHLFINVPP